LTGTTWLGAATAVTASAHEPATRPRIDAASRLSAAPPLPPIRPAPELALLDADRRDVRLSMLRGRIVLVSFFYASCTTACPLLTRRMALLRERLAQAPGGREVVFLSATVDPERDDAETLRTYARRFGADTRRWSFLRHDPSACGPLSLPGTSGRGVQPTGRSTTRRGCTLWTGVASYARSTASPSSMNARPRWTSTPFCGKRAEAMRRVRRRTTHSSDRAQVATPDEESRSKSGKQRSSTMQRQAPVLRGVTRRTTGPS
jgi:hypothetical protein